MIQGYTGQIDMWLNRTAFELTMVERLDAMFAAGDCPDALVVFVDCWTSYGGSQFLNSTRARPLPGLPVRRGRRRSSTSATRRSPTATIAALTGKSSGGYGAMVVPMLRPDVFGALASHAGDALFEACYVPEFPQVARALRDDYDGSYEVFFERLATADHIDWDKLAAPLEMYGYAAAYSPDPGAAGQGAAAVRHRDRSPARRRVGAVARQGPGADGAARTPTRCARCAASTSTPGAATSTTSTSGRRRSRTSSRQLGVAHTLELFDGKHGGLTYRYPGAIRELVLALSR